MTSLTLKVSDLDVEKKRKILLEKQKKLKEKLDRISSKLEETELDAFEKARTRKIYKRLMTNTGLKKRKRGEEEEIDLLHNSLIVLQVLSIDDTFFLIVNDVQSIRDVTALFITCKSTSRFLKSESFERLIENRFQLLKNFVDQGFRDFPSSMIKHLGNHKIYDVIQKVWERKNVKKKMTSLKIIEELENLQMLMSISFSLTVKHAIVSNIYLVKEDKFVKMREFLQNQKGGNFLLTALNNRVIKPENFRVHDNALFDFASKTSYFSDCFVSNGKKMVYAKKYFESRGYTVYCANPCRGRLNENPFTSVVERIGFNTFTKGTWIEIKTRKILDNFEQNVDL